MIAVISADDVTPRVSTKQGRTLHVTDYLGQPKKMLPGPQCFLIESPDDDAMVRPHFHGVDQFQIFWQGGMAGNHPRPGHLSIHYADAFAAYGPITAGEGGFRYMTIRSAADPGPQYMPESRRFHRGGRRVNVDVLIPSPEQTTYGYTEAIPQHADGLAAGVLTCPAGDSLARAAPRGTIHYLILDGSATHGQRALPPLSHVFTDGTRPTGIVAGDQGLVTLVLQLPTPAAERGRTDEMEQDHG